MDHHIVPEVGAPGEEGKENVRTRQAAIAQRLEERNPPRARWNMRVSAPPHYKSVINRCTFWNMVGWAIKNMVIGTS